MTKPLSTTENPQPTANGRLEAFTLRAPGGIDLATELRTHVHGNHVICDTEPRGHSTPRGMSLEQLVLHNSDGFIPLWDKGVTLRWRFRETSMAQFSDPEAAKVALRGLLAAAIIEWGAAAPIKFKEDDDLWDFEVVVRTMDECNSIGCVLARAFFPDPGRHELTIYPRMFGLPRQEQIETLIHELGHIFGLRHFFANLEDKPFVPFGVQSQFTIMNYGPDSALTETDKVDLQRLYQAVWSGALKRINGTPIRLMKPFNTLATVDNTPAITSIQTNYVQTT